jgi:hypothetical protein
MRIFDLQHRKLAGERRASFGIDIQSVGFAPGRKRHRARVRATRWLMRATLAALMGKNSLSQKLYLQPGTRVSEPLRLHLMNPIRLRQ